MCYFVNINSLLLCLVCNFSAIKNHILFIIKHTVKIYIFNLPIQTFKKQTLDNLCIDCMFKVSMK